MANWQGNTQGISPLQFSTLVGEVNSIPREVTTSTIFVSSIYVSSLGTFNDLSANQVSISSLVTVNLSTIFGEFTLLSLSSLRFSPQFSNLVGEFKPKIDLGMGGFFGNLLGQLGSGALSVGLGGAALATGVAAVALPRGYKQLNNSVFETVNGTTQLQVSTLGNAYPLYSTIFRTVSSIAPDQVPGPEIVVSSFFTAGTTCIRSISDPLDLPVDIYTGSTIQAFGQWVPIEISTGGGSYTPTPNFSNVLITYQDEPALVAGKVDNVYFSTGYTTLPPAVQVPNLTMLSSFHTHYSAVSQYNLYQTTFSTGDMSVNYADTFSTLTNFKIQTGTYDTFFSAELTDDFLNTTQMAGLNFAASTIGFGVSSFQTLTGTAPIQFQMDTQFNCNVIINNISTTNLTVGNNLNVSNNIVGQNAYFTGEIQASSLNILQTISTILTDTDVLFVSSLNATNISCTTAKFSTLEIGTTIFGDLVGCNVYVQDVLRFQDTTATTNNVQYDWLIDNVGAAPTSNLILAYLSSPYTDINVMSINGQKNFVGINKTPNTHLDVAGNISSTGFLAVPTVNAQTVNVNGNDTINTSYVGTGVQNVLQNTRATILPLQTVQISNVSCNNPNFQWNLFSTSLVEWTSTITLVTQGPGSAAAVNVNFWDLPNAQIDLQNNTGNVVTVRTIIPGTSNFQILVQPQNFPNGSLYRITLSPSGTFALLNPPAQVLPYYNNLNIYNDEGSYYITDSGTTFPNNRLVITNPLFLTNVQGFASRVRIIDVNANVNPVRYINSGIFPFQLSASAGFGGGVQTAQTTATITTSLVPPGGTQPSTFAFHASDWIPVVTAYSQGTGTTSVGFNTLQTYPQSSGGSYPRWQCYFQTVVNALAGSMNWTVAGIMIPNTYTTYSWL